MPMPIHAAPGSSVDAAIDRLLNTYKPPYSKAIDLSLDRMHRLLAVLGHPERDLPPVVHVAGTNGKGSVCAMIRAMSEQAGQRVHMYTSPHLVRVNERFVVASCEVLSEPLLEALQHVMDRNGDALITQFELLTAAAFVLFARTPADLCILEVGMGGRLDATNVVGRPAVCVINRISFDHQKFLGTTLGAIAREKAGIIKPDVPCVVGRQTDPSVLAAIREVAQSCHTPLFVEGQDWHSADITMPPTNLAGPHQTLNAALAVKAMHHSRLPFDPAGLTHVHWPGRLQRLTGGALSALLPPNWELWLDGAHNDSGAQVLADALAAWRAHDPRPIHLALGILTTKDVAAIAAPLIPCVHSLHALAIPDEPLAYEAPILAGLLEPLWGQPIPAYDGIAQAIKTIIAHTAPHDTQGGRIVIAGSLYLAGAVLTSEKNLR